jgi:YHS domain-containing protein
MLITVLATLAIGLAPQAPVVNCAVMGDATDSKSVALDYNGVRFPMCCDSCVTMFKRSPDRYLTPDRVKKSGTVGYSLFNPVTGLRIEIKDAKGGFADYQGVRYFFASADEKKAFDTDPKKFGTLPKNEALYCAVMGHGIKSYAAAGGYVDHNDTRLYVCCGGCMGKLKADTAGYADKSKAQVKKPAVQSAPKA